MELILFAMLGLIVTVAVLASRLNDNSFPFPFDRKSSVFTPAEKNFQTLVERALGDEYRILNRVKLSDIVTIRNGVSKKAAQTAINNANNKYLDFVICDRKSMQLLGTIDLVDTQGNGYKVKKDWFVSGALEAAAIPHIRIKIKSNYTVDEIRACINSKLLGHKVLAPKMAGRKIPASLIKPRPKNTGVLSPTAVKPAEQLGLNKPTPAQIPAPQVAALPH